MIRGTIIVLLFALLIFGPWYFLKNPFDAAYCLMSGNEWAQQGKNQRYCKEVFSDGGRLCAKNSDCKAKKCVIGEWETLKGFDADTLGEVSQENIALGVFKNILNEKIRGKCSRTNQSPCYSGEVLIDENRIIVRPAVCD